MPSGDLSNWLFLAQRLFDDLVTLLRVPPTRFGHLVLPASLPAYLWPNNSHLSSVPNLVGHDIYHALPASLCGRKNQTQHGPFAPETLLSFFAPTGHSAILLPSAPFPCQQL